jgi:hypothetical protein
MHNRALSSVNAVKCSAVLLALLAVGTPERMYAAGCLAEIDVQDSVGRFPQPRNSGVEMEEIAETRCAPSVADGGGPYAPGPGTEPLAEWAELVSSSDDSPGEPAGAVRAVPIVKKSKPFDFNRAVFHKNKLEFSFETGFLPINIPFVFDFLLGDDYKRDPLNYTLVPIFLSFRWQMNNLGGPWILRGNWELALSGSATIIPRGPETRYFAYDMGIRRYFVHTNWRVAPYFEGRLGMGDINAKEPYGATFGQGQDFTFTVMLGSGVRYSFSPRYAIWAGATYMHVSNMYLSEPKYWNNGINVVGPLIGIDVRLGKGRTE